MCEAKYRFAEGLANHMIKIHNIDGTHACHNCDRKFFDEIDLTKSCHLTEAFVQRIFKYYSD